MRWVLLAMFVVACGTTGALRQEPLDHGAQRLFRYKVGWVSDAAKAALEKAGFDVKESAEVRDGVWTIMAVKGVSLMSYGELVRVTLFTEDSDKTVARLITKKRLATNVAAKGDWSAAIYEDMESILTDRRTMVEQAIEKARRPPR